MARIVVFDDGWGGELVANFLMKELKIVEIVRVIDWAEAPYSGKTVEEICDLAISRLSSYVGMVDVIVLAGYTVSLAINELRRKFPGQAFVGMSIDYDRILKSRNSLENVVVMAERIVGMSDLQLELRLRLPYSTIILPDCDGWQQKIDDGAMTNELLRMDLATDFLVKNPAKKSVSTKKIGSMDSLCMSELCRKKISLPRQTSARVALEMAIRNLKTASDEVKDVEKIELKQRLDRYSDDHNSDMTFSDSRIRPDVVLLLNTHFWDIKGDIEEVLGWNVRVMDFREKLLRDLCRALKLRGVDGKRPK